MLFDLDSFVPTDTATLLFVRRGLDLLLIRKRRGLGAGKINAPGGRLEPGETPAEAAVREVREEVGVVPTGVRPRGELRFRFADGYALHCHVFAADGCEGDPVETPEAFPLWIPIDAIPYDEMWADDHLWLPRMLAGWGFDGRFLFDGDTMVRHDLRLSDPGAEALRLLGELGIAAPTVDHAPVFTVSQAKAVRREPGGVHVRNLFLRDKRGEMWLVTVPEDEAVELRALAERLGTRHLSFASPERLRKHLGVEPGSVTPLAAISDRQDAVRVAIATSVLDAPAVHVHPLTNDRTTVLSGPDLERFLVATGHVPRRL